MKFLSYFSGAPPSERPAAPLMLHNTQSGEKERFEQSFRGPVRMYNCGPTVYGRQHIGNLSMFVFADALRRTLEYNGYAVKQVINFTDFGHLTGDNDGDADHGEDRMTKGLKREGLKPTLENMKILAKKYAEIFLHDIGELNINTKRITFPYASEYIPAQIAMIKALEEKGYAYRAEDGVYFDTALFPDYGRLGNIDIAGLRAGARVALSSDKRTATDFLLWKSDKKMGWDSPWGRGFPGWHIECSAMIRATLGEQIDIHTGGIEHIAIHHNNEIAQSEASTGKKPLSRYWLHRAHIQIEGGKIAKSTGAVVYLDDVIQKGFHPLALRYLFLGAHYRTAMNFTWEALAAAQSAYGRLVALRLSLSGEPGAIDEIARDRFAERINDDLDTAGAIGVIWDMLKKDDIAPASKLATLLDADRVLGLNLAIPDDAAVVLSKRDAREYIAPENLSAQVMEIVRRRDEARAEKNWTTADALREELAVLHLGVEDTPDGPRVFTLERND